MIADGARHLAQLVSQLRHRGAVGVDVVVAGSVIVNQPRLLEAFRRHIEENNIGLGVHMLRTAPANGAVLLARQALQTA